MYRRLVGGLLFAVVLSLSIVVPNLGGRRIEGTGTPIQFPADPQVGDCLLEPLNETIFIQPTSSGSSLAPTFAPCGDREAGGQVVAVVRGSGDVRARLRQAAASGVDCYQSSLRNSGLVLAGGRYVLADHSATDPVDWNLTINARTAWVVPGPLLRTVGQTWVACVAAPLSGATFRGQLAGAFSGGTLPDEFSFCWAQNTPSAIGAVPCSSRHLAELVSLGTIPGGTGVALAVITSSCQELAAQVVGRSDPTAAGDLAVRTSVSSDVSTSSTLPQTERVVCYIEPLTRPLSGTLVGLGDRPIPYSN
jgi:hypothetical protein